MKWKKKGGAFRCGEGEAQVKVEELEGKGHLSYRLPGGAWEQGQLFDSVADAKDVGEKVLSSIIEFVNQEKAYFQKRRDFYTERQKKRDSLTPEEKSLRAAFEAYVKLSPLERDYARKQAPRVIGIFDKVLAEEQQEGQATDA